MRTYKYEPLFIRGHYSIPDPRTRDVIPELTDRAYKDALARFNENYYVVPQVLIVVTYDGISKFTAVVTLRLYSLHKLEHRELVALASIEKRKFLIVEGRVEKWSKSSSTDSLSGRSFS